MATILKTKKQTSQSIKTRVVSYWTGRAETFGEIRRKELHNEIGRRWDEALVRAMIGTNGDVFADSTAAAELAGARVLDVGTGTGEFAILLARRGCRVTGIDLTPAMIDEARRQAAGEGLDIAFEVMDAQEPEFPAESFDYVVTRNLTWTLPDAEKAYESWHSVLRPGGRLINFDANYAASLRREEEAAGEDAAEGAAERKLTYGHDGVTEEQTRVNREITLAMPVGREDRPAWDLKVLTGLGFRECAADLSAGERILRENSNPEAPIFMVTAVK